MKCIKGRWTTVTAALLSAALSFGILSTTCAKPAYAEDGGRKKKADSKPIYPDLARRMNITGTVKVEIVIDSAGTVKSAKALGGHPLLIPAAVDAAKKWRYEPSNSESTEILEFRFSPGL